MALPRAAAVLASPGVLKPAPCYEIVLRGGSGRVEVHVDARSFVPFHRVEVLWNGAVVASREDQAGTREMTLRDTVSLSGPGWLAARCSSRVGLTTAWNLAIQAHTSPIYFRVPGRDLFSAPAVGYMLTLIDGAETWTRTLATRSDPERMERVLALLREAADPDLRALGAGRGGRCHAVPGRSRRGRARDRPRCEPAERAG